MKHYVKVTGENIRQYLQGYDVLVCSIKPSRSKAMELAAAELFFALRHIGCIYIPNGPMGNIKGLISFFIEKAGKGLLKDILKNIGYCNRFYMLDFSSYSGGKQGNKNQMWKGMEFTFDLLYEQCEDTYESQSSHNREFLIYAGDGSIKTVKGYRGDGSATGRRALPVEDARLMVNLAAYGNTKVLMDPFAGSGGILYQARYIDPSLFLISADIDPDLEPGLQEYADRHCAMDARKVKIKDMKIDAIVSEVPFSKGSVEIIAQSFAHLCTYLDEKGKIVLMCSKSQFGKLKSRMENMKLHCLINNQVDRKGTEVVVSVWCKSKECYDDLRDFALAISNVF